MQENFQVIINGVALFCEKQKSIRFVRKQNQFCISAEEPDISLRKGTGLLDVYYGPLRIVHDGSDLALLVAQKFSEPEAASFSPKLNVKYPIYGSADLPSSEINHNIILINGDTLGAKKLNLPIMVNSDGCESIDGTCYKGDCCVFQRVPNPYNPQNSVLHISSNNLEKLKHHLLLRKIILPSMLTGISPYWNNEALIITEDGFIPIYEW